MVGMPESPTAFTREQGRALVRAVFAIFFVDQNDHAASAQFGEIDQSQRDIVQDHSEAERMLGSLTDYQRRFDSAAAAWRSRRLVVSR